MLSFTSDGKSVVWKRGGELPFAINVESMLPSKPQTVDLLDRSLDQTSNGEENGGDESRLLEPPYQSLHTLLHLVLAPAPFARTAVVLLQMSPAKAGKKFC